MDSIQEDQIGEGLPLDADFFSSSAAVGSGLGAKPHLNGSISDSSHLDAEHTAVNWRTPGRELRAKLLQRDEKEENASKLSSKTSLKQYLDLASEVRIKWNVGNLRNVSLLVVAHQQSCVPMRYGRFSTNS